MVNVDVNKYKVPNSQELQIRLPCTLGVNISIKMTTWIQNPG
jgi:hypothetical protein